MYLCINVSMYLYSYPSIHDIPRPGAGSGWEQFEVCLKLTNEWTQRHTPRPWSRECQDKLPEVNQAKLQLHLEAVIEWTYRGTPRSWTIVFENALGGRNRTSLNMHFGGHDLASLKTLLEAAWSSWLSEFRSHHWASLAIHLEPMIVWTCRL